MRFLNLRFKGITTTPWHIGDRIFGDYRYSRRDYLWGRAVRGAILTYLWRTYCHKSDIREKVRFNPDEDCKNCKDREECPFFNLRGSGEGEFKDTPKLIVTNLKFKNKLRKDRIPLISLDEEYLGVSKGPVWIEFIPSGAEFEFEIILIGDGVRFKEDVKNAVRSVLTFFGLGGFKNEGFGRGRISDINELNLEEFRNELLKIGEKIKDEIKRNGKITFEIEPILMLEKNKNEYFTSIIEKGFKEKLINCLCERYWQFFKENIYIPIEEVTGASRSVKIRAWSRKYNREIKFEGIAGELTIHISEVSDEQALALALAKYGIGKFKNMGFGSLILKAL